MLKRFFITCSGADRAIIYNCSDGEQNKYAGIGATVFFTALLAWVAASYALYTVFDNIYMAAAFGLLWGLLIFNLDRFIVSTIRKRDNFRQELLQATPRIILAIIIAIVISKPLEIKIFEKEIDTVLLKEKNKMALANKKQTTDYYATDFNKNKAAIDSLKSEIVAKEKEVNALYSIYITEAEGTSGTKKLGKGPVYKEKREKHDAALAQLNALREKNTAKIEAKEAMASSLQTELDNKINESKPIIDKFDGLMARINALNKLPLLPSLFIMLLFLAIETSPIIAKLLSPKGEYDFKLEENEMAIKTNLTQNNYQRDLMRTTDAKIYDDVYAEIRSDKELYNYKKKKAIELLEMQADSFSEKQKNIM
ncbi:MAG: hypothetical protein BM557_02735 [Flavobacterium sp. MedPE-SWcel]|uniref:DUF4407 domain-containing protein n=1 Tax=uncultured Flavobacterium sp. TaxID=165435 RepID=UPI000914D198|nr:DUF4407 domain-containing protein [uncultured Flavobacterium sp.]OIQ21730.1 MAG: hypothetical protein BM557_02735 [Flavobacterium sp. MedPE-SWcel]